MQEVVKRLILGLGLVFQLAMLSGCTADELVDNLSQTQATTIVATLAQNGIPAQSVRSTSSRGRYSVTVKHQHYSQAITILHERGLPKPEEMSFSESIASKGLLPNSREVEALRLDRAQAAELEESLKVYPGVQQARAIVRRLSLPEQTPPSVSVVMEVKEGIQINQDEIRSLVQRAIPGTVPENISVAIVSAASFAPVSGVAGVEQKAGRIIHVPLAPFLGFWRIPEGDLSGLSLMLLLGLVIIGGLGAFLGYWYGYLQQTRMLVDNGLPDFPRPLRQIERPRRIETEEEEVS